MFYYLASPYDDPDPAVREQRYRQVCQVAARMIRDGHLVFSPIAYSHPMSKFGLPGDWLFWRRYDNAMLERCDALVVVCMDGWNLSVGVRAECELARQLEMSIQYANLTGQEIFPRSVSHSE
jgi:hypothetical protein